jgi:rare lipoprotein A
VVLLACAATAGIGFSAWDAQSPAAPEAVSQTVELGDGLAGVKDGESPLAASAAEPTAADTSAEVAPAERLEEGQALGAGEASYYGQELAGNPTASGERFDPEGLTAAHRTLPLGSRLRVTNPRNGESVVVRVNDRGPFAGHRVVDVSERAARELGILRAGTAQVELELLPRKRG